MANLTEASTFDAGVYRIETTDAVIGGETGIANKAAKNLANRTKYLNDQRVTMLASMALTDADVADHETRVTSLETSRTTDEAAIADHETRIDTLEASTSGVPSGLVAAHANSAVPSGWLKCNGAAVSRTTYAALFAVIGVTHGSGNGSTTFNVPELRGEFIRGWDDSRGVDSGRVFASSQSDLIANHVHPYTAQDGASGSIAGGSSLANAATQSLNTSNNTGGGAETRPRNVALLFCIKY